MAARGGYLAGRSRRGSSARASLSGLYGSTGLTGAAERETGRVSVGAGSSPLPPIPQPGPGSVYVSCLFSSASRRGATGFPRRAVLRSGWAWGLSGLCPGFSQAAPEPLSALRRKRPRAFYRAGDGPARVCRERARGPQPPLQPPPRAEKRGRYVPETAERGGDGSSLRRAKRGSAAAASPEWSGSRRRRLRFCRPFPVVERAWGRRPLGAQRSGCLGKDLWAPFSLQSARLRRGPCLASPGAGAAKMPSPGAAERRGAGRGLQRGAAK